MIVQRPRHDARVAEYQPCPDEQLDTMHGVTRVLYWGGVVASTIAVGTWGAVGMLVAFGAGSLNESTAKRQQERDAQRAAVAGGALVLTDDEKKQRALLAFSERFVPLVFLRK
jgi:hypothetical protein